jgi:hypothetical protein
MQRPGAEMASFAAIAGAETAPTREFGRHVFDITALLRVSITPYNYRVCVVGATGIEPGDPVPNSVRDSLLAISNSMLIGGRPRCFVCSLCSANKAYEKQQAQMTLKYLKSLVGAPGLGPGTR